MRTSHPLLLLLAMTALSNGVVHAAEPLLSAQTRAVLYQREVRAAFAKAGWFTVAEEPGRLSVEHGLIPVGTDHVVYAPGRTYAHLTIRFRPDTTTHTETNVTAAKYIRSSRPGRLDWPPFVLHNPQVDQACRKALAQAESRLATKQPDHNTPQKDNSGSAGKSVRIAMR